jgi:hypothetical protein
LIDNLNDFTSGVRRRQHYRQLVYTQRCRQSEALSETQERLTEPCNCSGELFYDHCTLRFWGRVVFGVSGRVDWYPPTLTDVFFVGFNGLCHLRRSLSGDTQGAQCSSN